MEQNKIDKISKAVESLNKLCVTCELGLNELPSKGASSFKRCPFRSISNDYCDEFEAISQCLNRLEEVIEIIKCLKDEADYLEECTDGETSDIYMAKYTAYETVLQLIFNEHFFSQMKNMHDYEYKILDK